MTKRHRTTFPNTVNFSGWWVLSKKGCVAQLKKAGRNLHEHSLYVLKFANGQTGNGQFTIEQLRESGATQIRREKQDLPANHETKTN